MGVSVGHIVIEPSISEKSGKKFKFDDTMIFPLNRIIRMRRFLLFSPSKITAREYEQNIV
jgi:hypothetical protein